MSDAKTFLMSNSDVYFGKEECGPYSVLNKPEHNVSRFIILSEQTETSLLVTGILVTLRTIAYYRGEKLLVLAL
jgi:hypothetical protein